MTSPYAFTPEELKIMEKDYKKPKVSALKFNSIHKQHDDLKCTKLGKN